MEKSNNRRHKNMSFKDAVALYRKFLGQVWLITPNQIYCHIDSYGNLVTNYENKRFFLSVDYYLSDTWGLIEINEKISDDLFEALYG